MYLSKSDIAAVNSAAVPKTIVTEISNDVSEALSIRGGNSGSMSLRDEGEPPDPILVLKTFGRIAISDIVTIFVLSILYSIASMSIVTIGPAFLALMDAFYSSVSHTGTGGGAPASTRGRASQFVSSIWTYLRTGLPYTVAILIVLYAFITYALLAISGGSIQATLFGIVGIYVSVLGFLLLFRAADIVVRADDSERPGFFGGLRLAWKSFGSNIPFAATHIVTAIAVTSIAIPLVATLVCVLPGLLALLELLNYEELDGAGAKAIRYAYLDPQT